MDAYKDGARPGLGNGKERTYNTGSESKKQEAEPVLLAVGHVASMLSCSERSVWRLSDEGKMPAPVRIGRLVRWSRDKLNEWIDAGCPRVRPLRRAS